SDIVPMAQSGHKLAFYTGGAQPNILRSRADITTGQYVHVVTTRDQLTGEKRIYVNGVLDASVFSTTNTYPGTGALTLGYNNGNVFNGRFDEVQIYAGVLSSNEVAFLYAHPATNAVDVGDVSAVLVGRYDFEDTNSAGLDSSGHHNDTNCGGTS